jgi:hypothetical protein
VWVSPSTFRRVLAAHRLVLPEPVTRDPIPKPGLTGLVGVGPQPHLVLGRNPLQPARRVAFAIVDVVPQVDRHAGVGRKTSTQV